MSNLGMGNGNVQLNGINWNNVPAQQPQPQYNPQPVPQQNQWNQQPTRWQNDQTQMNNYNQGYVPSTGQIPEMFPENQQYPSTNTQQQKIGVASENQGAATGVGVVVGAIAGGVIGKKFVPSVGAKWGALIGVAVGGFIGNQFEK